MVEVEVGACVTLHIVIMDVHKEEGLRHFLGRSRGSSYIFRLVCDSF